MKPDTNKKAVYKAVSGLYCSDNFHIYPTMYAGDPEYADQYFSKCLCGMKMRVTTVTEVDIPQQSKEEQ